MYIRPVIGLFGTCGTSTWRQKFIEKCSLENIPYFNPQVKNWHPGLVVDENRHLAEDAIILFPVLAETTGQGSLAETGFSILNALRQNRALRYFVFLIDDDCTDPNASPGQIKDSVRTRALIKSKIAEESRNCHNVFLVSTMEEMFETAFVLWQVVDTATSVKQKRAAG